LGWGEDLDIELLEALIDIKAMEQDLARGHHSLGKLEQDPPLLNELAPIYPQLGLHLPRNSVQPAQKVGQDLKRRLSLLPPSQKPSMWRTQLVSTHPEEQVCMKMASGLN